MLARELAAFVPSLLGSLFFWFFCNMVDGAWTGNILYFDGLNGIMIRQAGITVAWVALPCWSISSSIDIDIEGSNMISGIYIVGIRWIFDFVCELMAPFIS